MDDLERLFAAYRETLPDPEPSANFTPGVWQGIEARRSPVRLLRRATEALVALTALATLVIGLFLIPRLQSMPVYSASYIDVLENEQSPETMAYSTVSHSDPVAEAPTR